MTLNCWVSPSHFKGCLQPLATWLLSSALSRNPWRYKRKGLADTVLISRAKFQIKASFSNMPSFEKSEADGTFNRPFWKFGFGFKTWEWDPWSIWTKWEFLLICSRSLHLCFALFHSLIIHQALMLFMHELKFESICSPAEIILFWWQKPVFWAKKNEQRRKKYAFYDLKYFSTWAFF